MELNFKKASTEIIKMNVGDEIVGKFTGKSIRPWVDNETGEEKEITQYHLNGINPNTGKEDLDKKLVVFADAGLQNIFSTENIKEGTIVKIVKLDKITRGKKQINQYELYTA